MLGGPVEPLNSDAYPFSNSLPPSSLTQFNSSSPFLCVSWDVGYP